MRTYAFIDGQNLHRGVEAQGWMIDYVRFRRFLLEKFHVERAFYFLGYRPQFQSLYDRLARAGFELVFAPTLERGTETKGNVDVLLTLHVMRTFAEYDAAVIVSSDGDFAVLVEHLHQKRKLGQIIAPHRATCSKLLRRFDRYLTYLERYRSWLEYRDAHS